jgi:hypothetical protein
MKAIIIQNIENGNETTILTAKDKKLNEIAPPTVVLDI